MHRELLYASGASYCCQLESCCQLGIPTCVLSATALCVFLIACHSRCGRQTATGRQSEARADSPAPWPPCCERPAESGSGGPVILKKTEETSERLFSRIGHARSNASPSNCRPRSLQSFT